MGSNDEFGPDTETIRAWLEKRASYAKDARVVEVPRAAPVAADRSGVPDSTVAARSVLDALHAEAPAPPVVPEAVEAPPATTDARVAPPPAEVEGGRWTEPVDNITAPLASTDVEFPARSGVRRTLTVLVLAALAVTAAAAYRAWQEQTSTAIGLAVICAVLALVVWAARAGCTTTQLAIRRGQLSVRRGGATEVVDLSHYTPVAIIGEPGQRRWRVLVERPGRPLVVITPGMVDAHWFTTALYRIRPDLRPQRGPAPDAEDPDVTS